MLLSEVLAHAPLLQGTDASHGGAVGEKQAVLDPFSPMAEVTVVTNVSQTQDCPSPTQSKNSHHSSAVAPQRQGAILHGAAQHPIVR